MARWFVDGQTNLCHNAVDRHVAARPDQPALIHVSTETGEERVLSYGQLHVEVQRMAAVLQPLGVTGRPRPDLHAHDPEAVIAMLATVRMGAISAWCLAVSPATLWPPALTMLPHRDRDRRRGLTRNKVIPTSLCWTKPCGCRSTRWRMWCWSTADLRPPT